MEEKLEEQEPKPAYIAILPANVRYNQKLKAMEKIMYAEITSLANSKGYCYASNAYFAKLYNVAKKTISSWINSLKKHGLVDIEIIKEKEIVKERRIYISDGKKVSISAEGVSTKKRRGYPSNDGGGIHQKVKENNIIINNKKEYSASPDALDETPLEKEKTEQEKQIEELWKMYPLKKGKANAIKKIPKLIKQYGYEQLTRCIARYKEFVVLRQRTDFKDLKYQNGSTFFNGGYMDYLDVEYNSKETTKTTQDKKIDKNKETDIDLGFWNK